MGALPMDTFARDRLPPRGEWPDLLRDRPELAYPDRLNAVAELVDRWVAEGHGDRPAVIGQEETWSYASLSRRVDSIARVLTEEFGLTPGGRVLLRGPNTPMMAACWLAIVKAGGIVVPTMPLLRATELTYILDKARIGAALGDARFMDDLTAAAAGAADPPMLAAFNGDDRDPAGLEARAARRAGRFPAADTAADDVALIAFTSGTTGRPKATMHFHRDLLTVADLSPRSILKTRSTDVFCGIPSLAFAYGLGGLLLFPLRVGASTVLLERPTPDRLVDAIRRHRATILFAVPTAYRAAIAHAVAFGLGTDAFESLRLCVSAGEPLPQGAIDMWRRVTGRGILDSLGTTEMLNAVLHARPESGGGGGTGWPVPGYEAKVVDDALQPVPVGQVGRLMVRGPTGCRYLDDDRQRFYVRQGWNLTGDTCHVDEDGVFHYHGRTDDLIVSAGHKISGLEVEDVLLEHDLVDECAVVAAPDELRGTVPKAFVVLREDVRPTDELVRELQDFVKQRIAPYKHPRAIEFMEALPRTETGKIQRYKLREMAWQDYGG